MSSRADGEFPPRMTLAQVCRFFGVSQATVYRWQVQGLITPVKMPGRLGNRPIIRYHRAACEELLRKWSGQEKRAAQ